MLLAVAQYFSFNDHVGFLQFKQEYLHIGIWKAAFYVHVFSAIIALFAGFTQFSPNVLKKHKKLHRTIGKIYAVDILLVNFPAGMIIAVYANGLLPTKMAFVILDILWVAFTYIAVMAARQKKFKIHREFMIRSYALTLSALSLRMWKVLFAEFSNIGPMDRYRIIAWLGWGLNLLIAEFIIMQQIKKKRMRFSV